MSKITTEYKYYEIVSSCGTVQYGSYDRQEALYELEAERDNYKEDGYKGTKLRWKAVEEAPDPAIYGKKFKPNTIQVVSE
tara:strand:- start:1881 stop:2120 length:240 start_codon:yes stop_codon:yes gene_type:complete